MALVLLDKVGGEDDPTKLKLLEPVSLGLRQQRNALAAGLSSGVDQLQGLGYSIAGGAADLVGADTARDWANEQARRNQIDAALAGRPDLENIEDQTLGSALPYMGYQIVKQVPIMAGITGAQFIPGAGQAATALGLTRLGALAPRFLGGAGLEAGASIAARRAALAQGETLATGTMAGSALGFGSMYGESVEGGDPNAWKALALSPIYGAAEAVLPAVLHGGLRLPSRYSGNLATRMAKAGGVAGSGEALTELGQNELEMGMRSDLTDQEKASRRLNSAAAGFLVGGGLGTVGGLKGAPSVPTGINTQQVDLMSGESQVTRPAGSQFKTADQMVGLQTFINQNTGVDRQARKNYEAQFKAAYDEPSGQFVTDPATGIERQLSIGEYQRMQGAALDLTQDNPAAAAAANAAAIKIQRDPKDIFIRDTLKVIPNQYSRQLFDTIAESGIDPQSDLMVPVWNYAAQKYMGKGRYEKAVQLMDEAIIKARKGAPSGTPISTGLGAAGSVGVGGAVVPGAVGATGSVSPVTGAVGGTTSTAGAPLQQTGVVSGTSGQPSTVVDQGPTTRGAPGTTALVDTSDDAWEIARATGNAAEIEAMREDEAGGRADQLAFGNTEMEAVIGQHLAKSKNKERDRKILQAYILARKSVPEGYKGDVAQEVADTFNIDVSRVRQIGNPELLANIAEDMGFDRSQVFTHLGIDSATKSATTELGKLESDLAKLEAKATPSKADIAKMSELSEKIDQVKGNIESGDMTSALKALGLEGEAGEMFSSLDDSREWQKASTAGSQMAVKLVGIADKIAELRAAAAELKQLGLAKAEAAATERINALTADYQALTASITAPKAERKQAKSEKKTEDEQKAAEEKAAALKAEAEKLSAEAAAKRAVDRKGLEVGDTVVNTKLGTGVVKSFSGDGDATLVTVDFKSGQTKELSVKMAKLEKTNAVQVQGTAVVSVQPKTEIGKGVGGQVRRAKKPTAESQAQGQAKGQVDKGRALWESLTAKTPGLVPYEQLNKLEQDYLTDLAVRTNGKPVVAKEMGLQQLLTREPVTIDVEARVIDEQVTQQVAALPAPQVERLEQHYGAKRGSAEFLEKVQADITKYVTQGAEAVAGAIRSIIKAMAEGVLAMGIVFNPNITKDAFNINVAKTFQQTIEVTQEVPEAAKAQMSPTAQAVYSAMAPVAMKSGKWFMVADKPNGMLHIFKEDGSHALSDPTLYGKDKGDVLDAVSSLEGGPKITPAGKFTMKESPAEYAGGTSLILMESKDYTGYIAVHAADTSTRSENRLGRLASKTAEDNRISYGCINTKHDTFINEIKPNISKLDGGMMFILPEAEDQAAKMFAAETRTETRTEGGQGATGNAAASVVGKEENMLFGKDRVASKPYTAEELTAEIKDFVRADITDRKLVIVDSIDDLLNSGTPEVQALGEAIQAKGAYGVAQGGVAYLIANRISKGQGRAKFMHEVGAHLGLENLLPKAVYDRLVDQLETWAESGKDSLEAQLAAKAKARVGYAKTPTVDEREELLAYFVEEAMLAGVDPTASTKESGPLMAWFRTLWAAFKVAVRRLGFKPENLSAQDVVNLAFGAARLEMNGSWHGTAATFRRFNHAFMNSGEGAQAYGWGTYLAQAVGIGQGYWLADVERKLSTTGKLPDGSLMRMDTAVPTSEMIDWDASFANQPKVVTDFIKKEAPNIKALRDQGVNIQITSGAGIVKYLTARFYKEGGYKGSWKDADPAIKMAVKEQASKYLEANGIQGIQFYDATSREVHLDNVSFTKNGKTVKGRDGVLQAYFTPGAIVQGYGGPDKVIKFDPVKELITVIAVDNLGNPRRGERERTHFTMPSIVEVATAMQQRGYDLGASNRTRNLVIFNEKNIFRAGSEAAADKQRMKFGVNAPNQGTIQRNIAKLPKASRSPVRNIVLGLGDLGGAGLDYVVFTSDLVKRAVAVGLTSAQTFADALAQRRARVSEFEREIESIADGYADIEPEFKGAGRGSVNDFLFESTRTLKWGYGKYRDAKMGDAFDKLGPKAQKFVKAVFAHGDKILSQKKQSVLKSANSEYDAMIQAAQDAVNAAQIAVNTATDAKTKTDAEKQLVERKQDLAEVKAEKVATLKRFQTLFAIREGKPYAPIKRDGAYVVIGKSAAYKAAEAAKDRKRIKQLESDPDHYHVSFVDTKWAARTLSDNLTDQGVFTQPDIVKRATAFEETFSGEALLPALTKIRASVDKRDDSNRSKMLNIVNQLYLEALAEGSARKSEMRRRGVAGEVDMLQSFTRQGRADANFLANVEFEPLIQDALQQMRNDRGGNRERKSEIFDELTKRYVDSLETKGNGFITGLTNTASKYFLASSPAYYMQNLTQPFMMSLPALAGRHDYTKAGKALFDAYAELGPLFKDVKLFDQQFDFSKVPADVRAAITKLVNQGQIDIGLATEINEYKVDADSKLGKFAQRLNKSMRLAVQKVEATNRLSTAIAAYRLEFARTKDAEKATQYAADILTDTHGDYTAMNAPRIFNSQWGKVALQFRKFQLIQIAFYAKLLRDAFTNPAERAVAMRTLAFSLGHTAVFAGMMGLPGYAAIAAILGFFGDEDEPYDLTADMRQALGPEWADLIMRGAPTLVGVDLSGKIGAGNMLSIMPFSDADLSTTAGRAEAFGTLVGGASLGMVSRVADGMGLILSGDYYKGIERTMPKGVSDALKAGRQAAEGMTRRNGDVVLPADEVSAISAILTGLGVPSVKETVVYERQNRMRDLTSNFQDRTTRIKNDYAKAVRENDGEGKQNAREAWQKLQRTRQENGLKPQPLSNLLKAPQEQREREKQTVGGVQYTKGTRKLAEEIAEG